MLKESKHHVLAIVFASVTLASATQSDAIAETKEVEIILTGEGFLFKEADIEIQKDDTVRWIVRAGTHRLKADSPPNAFKTTGDFNDKIELPFNNPGLVKYHCERHPDTMIGTINVKGQ